MNYPIKDTAFGRFYITNESLALHMDNQDPHRMWEDHLRPSFDQYAKDRAVIEVGASAGWHTVYLARLARTIVALEPQRPQFDKLKANLELNATTNVKALNVAAYSAPRTMRTDKPVPYDQLGHEACAMHLVNDQSGNIEAITIDSLRAENVGLIKVDAQGCDLHVLMGAIETIKREQPALLYEFDWVLAAVHGHTLDQYNQFVESIGYTTKPLSERDWIATPL